MDRDTIVAIATAPGEAGIGIVRISGDKAIEIADKIFKGNKIEKLSQNIERRLVYGNIVDTSNGKKIDEVLTVYMKSPNTYTKEDVVEIDCHGGVIAVRKILDMVIQNGARMAERGEFTKRAFLNGRLDLSQAEAVMDLISAKTDKSYEISLNQLEGGLSKEVSDIIKELMSMMAHIQVTIDFPEHDDEEITFEELKKSGNEILIRIDKLLDTVYTGKIFREGLKTVILGKPNVGKSSLMNSILRENKAIVTEIPGTTRDVIEEYVNIKGIPLKIIDTAGIRETDDVVEKIGVERAREVLEQADLVIAVFDASRELSEEDLNIIENIKDKKAIILVNKSDLPSVLSETQIAEQLSDKTIIRTSMTQKLGIDKLEETLKDMFFTGEVTISDNIIVTNVRHRDALTKAKANLKDALESIEMGMTLDCIDVDIKDCWTNLGEINGDTVSEDIVDKIFSDFCIGK